jgi:hypothetical protein
MCSRAITAITIVMITTIATTITRKAKNQQLREENAKPLQQIIH